jgi:hypothetical protein
VISHGEEASVRVADRECSGIQSPPAGFDRAANVKTVWALLVSAQLSGRSVTIYLDDAACNGRDIYLENY